MTDQTEQLLEQTVLDIQDRHPGLPILESVLLAAVHLELATDSRQLAKLFDMEHALVLRALTSLVDDSRLTITWRHARTARIAVAPTDGSAATPLMQTGHSHVPVPHHPR